MAKYLSGEGYRRACERYRAGSLEKAAALAADLKSTGRRLRVGHLVTVPQQYFPRLAEAFHEERQSVDYRVLHTSGDARWIGRIAATGIETTAAHNVGRPTHQDFDVVFIQHPYYSIGDVAIDFYGIMRDPPEFLFPADVDLHPLIAFIPYAYTVIDESVHKPVDGFHDLPVHNVAWRVYCETEQHRERAAAKSTLGAWNWRATGYPKLDEIRDLCSRRRRRWGRRDTTIIWAPHHNRSFPRIPMEELHRYFADLLEHNRELRLIFRPHPNLTIDPQFDFEPLGLTRSRFNEIMAYWSGHRRGSVDLGADLPALFAGSDLMVTDCGGFQAEYFVSGRPLISCISHRYLSPFMSRLVDQGNYFAGSVEEVDRALRLVLKGESNGKRAARMAAIEVIQPNRDASGSIVADLLRSLS